MGTKTVGEAERSTFVRHGKLRRSSSWANALRVLATTAVVVALSGVATVAYAVWGLTQDVDTVDLGDSADTVAAGSQSIDGPLTILLVGSDSRVGQSYDDGEEGELNDVTLMLHVSADHQSATVVSFPRDLMIPIPSCPGPDGEDEYYPAMSEQQLNSTLSYGGLPCTVRTIESLTGMDIPYAGLITFDGVIGVSNAIGGVDVCLTQPIVDEATELNLPAGENTLVGNDALQFLRTRHGVGDGGDTSRISNQQVFMSSLVRKLQSADTLSDPVKVYGLAKAAVENMTLSSNMANVQFMQQVAGTVKDIDLSRINFVQYPSFSHPYEEGRLTPDYASAEALFQVLQSGAAFTVAATGEGVAVEAGEAPTDGSAEAPVETTDPAAEDPAATDPAAGDPGAAEGATTTTDENGKVVLPENVTGQPADTVTCSAGRTVL
ncbi:LCP family protein [Leucobacter allii]|uniref:LCP family protein n=1 Tax=Leucobacter allii TaxID=2932247 RepID=A0ABY4FM08_9MICO|nr:LCP family protein [Leucobacter allii]UOQ57322.1 LCP family protein [Leucobacter allii]UOR01771.1 LCP family protein [Leucobacter allii]